MAAGNVENLKAAGRRKSQATTQRADQALRDLLADGTPITFRAVARQASCSVDFLYRHHELAARIRQLRHEQQTRGPVEPASSAPEAGANSVTLRTLVAQVAELKRRHRDEVGELRAALAAAHGELIELRRQAGRRPAV